MGFGHKNCARISVVYLLAFNSEGMGRAAKVVQAASHGPDRDMGRCAIGKTLHSCGISNRP